MLAINNKQPHARDQTARIVKAGHRQLKAMASRVSVKAIAEEIADLILSGSDDERILRLDDGSVKIRASRVFADEAASSGQSKVGENDWSSACVTSLSSRDGSLSLGMRSGTQTEKRSRVQDQLVIERPLPSQLVTAGVLRSDQRYFALRQLTAKHVEPLVMVLEAIDE